MIRCNIPYFNDVGGAQWRMLGTHTAPGVPGVISLLYQSSGPVLQAQPLEITNIQLLVDADNGLQGRVRLFGSRFGFFMAQWMESQGHSPSAVYPLLSFEGVTSNSSLTRILSSSLVEGAWDLPLQSVAMWLWRGGNLAYQFPSHDTAVSVYVQPATAPPELVTQSSPTFSWMQVLWVGAPGLIAAAPIRLYLFANGVALPCSGLTVNTLIDHIGCTVRWMSTAWIGHPVHMNASFAVNASRPAAPTMLTLPVVFSLDDDNTESAAINAAAVGVVDSILLTYREPITFTVSLQPSVWDATSAEQDGLDWSTMSAVLLWLDGFLPDTPPVCLRSAENDTMACHLSTPGDAWLRSTTTFPTVKMELGQLWNVSMTSVRSSTFTCSEPQLRWGLQLSLQAAHVSNSLSNVFIEADSVRLPCVIISKPSAHEVICNVTYVHETHYAIRSGNVTFALEYGTGDIYTVPASICSRHVQRPTFASIEAAASEFPAEGGSAVTWVFPHRLLTLPELNVIAAAAGADAVSTYDIKVYLGDVLQTSCHLEMSFSGITCFVLPGQGRNLTSRVSVNGLVSIWSNASDPAQLLHYVEPSPSPSVTPSSSDTASASASASAAVSAAASALATTSPSLSVLPTALPTVSQTVSQTALQTATRTVSSTALPSASSIVSLAASSTPSGSASAASSMSSTPATGISATASMPPPAATTARFHISLVVNV
ncbi:MAG: hypothetical protein EOO65_02520 [Methanosarcinales archaeon]|nr:MAG: hypothetical protein EOO65_02520 [Methanosarcinales archaeon]